MIFMMIKFIILISSVYRCILFLQDEENFEEPPPEEPRDLRFRPPDMEISLSGSSPGEASSGIFWPPSAFPHSPTSEVGGSMTRYYYLYSPHCQHTGSPGISPFLKI